MSQDLQGHIKSFLTYLNVERNCSPLTIRDYTHYLNEFFSWFTKNYPYKTISDVDIHMISSYRVYLSEKITRRKKLSKVSQNYYVICLRSFFKYLLRHDITVIAPDRIELPRTQSRSPKFLNRSQMDLLLQIPNPETIWGLRDRAILELMFSTGLRVSEVQRLNRTDINFDSMEFSVIGKGNKSRLVFLSKDAVEWLKKYLKTREDNYEPLFINYSSVKSKYSKELRFAKRGIQQMVTDYVAQAGLPVKATAHTLRHSYATDLLNNGADLRTVQELLGHRNIATTQIYTHVTNNQLREAHKKFHRT